jgi:hypothetical protein
VPTSQYLPLTRDVSLVERRFLDLVAPLGVDWLATRADYRSRFGVSSYHGWRDIIALPPSTALSRAPLAFVMYADDNVLDLAPEYLWADYVPHDDAHENHRDLEQQLTATFGEPSNEDTSNCIARLWTFGVFQIKLHTFPPELQSPALFRPGANPLLDGSPRLRIKSSVSLHSSYACVYPDDSLSPLAAWLVAPSPGAAAELASRAHDGRPGRYSPRRDTRRNPSALARVIPSGAVVAWRDETSQRVGLSAQRESVVFPSAQAVRLILLHLQPARGPGGFSVALETSPSSAPSLPGTRIQLFESGASLEPTANQLSRTWQLPLVHEQGFDE